MGRILGAKLEVSWIQIGWLTAGKEMSGQGQASFTLQPWVPSLYLGTAWACPRSLSVWAEA